MENSVEFFQQRVVLRGTVEGVGMRPALFRFARKLELTGWVRNRSCEVELVWQGSAAVLEQARRELSAALPPESRIDSAEYGPVEPLAAKQRDRGFAIRDSGDSASGGKVNLLTPPDLAPCSECRAEWNDPADRRFHHAFNSCGNCGPRATVIEALPYDREATAWRDFPLCPECRREYENSADRRFHIEGISCPHCGPRLELLGSGGLRLAEGDAALQQAGRALADGKILAAGSDANDLGHALIARFNSDGSLDTSFSGGGVFTTLYGNGTSSLLDLAFTPNGQVIGVGGSYTGTDEFGILRLASGVSDQTTLAGEAFGYTVPASAFYDADADPLSYRASLADGSPLPVWLTFDPATHSFSGTAASHDFGTLALAVVGGLAAFLQGLPGFVNRPSVLRAPRQRPFRRFAEGGRGPGAEAQALEEAHSFVVVRSGSAAGRRGGGSELLVHGHPPNHPGSCRPGFSGTGPPECGAVRA